MNKKDNSKILALFWKIILAFSTFLFVGILFLKDIPWIQLIKIFILLNGILFVLYPVWSYGYNWYEKRKKRKEQKSLTITKPEYPYYRDILEESSAGVLGVLANGKEEYVADIEAMYYASLLSLQLKGHILLKEDKIILLNKEREKLLLNEQFLINHLDCFLLKEDEWFEKVQQDVIEKKLAIKRITNIPHLLYFYLAAHVICFLIYITKNNADIKQILYDVRLLLPWILTIAISFIMVAQFDKKNEEKHAIILTPKGLEIYSKIEGLKQYLNEFSLIKERTEHELFMWREYIVYAALLDKKSKVRVQGEAFLKKLFQNQKKMQHELSVPPWQSIHWETKGENSLYTFAYFEQSCNTAIPIYTIKNRKNEILFTAQQDENTAKYLLWNTKNDFLGEIILQDDRTATIYSGNTLFGKIIIEECESEKKIKLEIENWYIQESYVLAGNPLLYRYDLYKQKNEEIVASIFLENISAYKQFVDLNVKEQKDLYPASLIMLAIDIMRMK